MTVMLMILLRNRYPRDDATDVDIDAEILVDC